jgi:hypothetical protein
MFQTGLGYINDQGGIDGRSTHMVVEYAPFGTTNWVPAPLSANNFGIIGRINGLLQAPEEPGAGDYLHLITPHALMPGTTGATVLDWGNSLPQVGEKLHLGPYELTVTGVSSNAVSWAEPLPGKISADAVGHVNFWYSGKLPEQTNGTGQGNWDFNMAKKGTFAASVYIKFPNRGQFSIRITKIDGDIDENVEGADRNLWKRTLVSLKSLTAIPPLAPEIPLAIVEIKPATRHGCTWTSSRVRRTNGGCPTRVWTSRASRYGRRTVIRSWPPSRRSTAPATFW